MTTRKRKPLLSRLFVGTLIVCGFYTTGLWLYNANLSKQGSTASTAYTAPQVKTETIILRPTQIKAAELPADYQLLDTKSLPKFVTIDGVQASIKPGRTDIGTYRLVLAPKQDPASARHVLEIKVALPKIDTKALQAEIASYLGSKTGDYGIYIEDLLTGETLTLNNKQYPPASIAKVPVAVLTMRDIDAGKYTLDTLITVQNKLKHSTSDAIGAMPAGTKLPVRRYLEEMIRVSSNTAWYHLREHLGGIWAEPNGVNARTTKELNANPFFEDPHIARPTTVGRVFADVYKRKTLSNASAQYLIDLLASATPSLRTGIPAGIGAEASAVSKVGFLFGGKDNTYADAGIVFAPTTDYVLAILNSKARPFPSGSIQIAGISRIVYKYLNR